MAMGQMQLAMEETEERKSRDGRAIQWLVGRMTEDAEMDSLVQAIPNSLNMGWGLKVWEQIMCHSGIPIAVPPPSPLPNNTSALSLTPNSPDAYPHSAITHFQEEDIGHELRIRVAHLLETCKTAVFFKMLKHGDGARVHASRLWYRLYAAPTRMLSLSGLAMTW